MQLITIDKLRQIKGGVGILDSVMRFVDQMTISYQVYQDTQDEKNKAGNLGLS